MDFNITYREKDGGLQAIISYKDINGKWKQKSKQGFEASKKGEKLAANWANDTITELKNSGVANMEYDSITFIEFYRLFISDRANTLSASTLTSYEMSLKHFESLYNIKLKDIKTIDIQREINKLNHLSSVSIETYLKNVNCLFNFAVNKYEIMNKNPIKNIEFIKSKSQEKKALTKFEVEKLLNNLKSLRSHRPYIASLVASKCGLRIGEICGLTWKDIDFANKNIDVNKQWIKDKKGICGFGALKSPNSYRIIPMPQIVYKELQNLRSYSPIDINGRILRVKNTTSFCANLINYYKNFGFDISVHELRHTYATNLIANGIDFKTAAKFLGHDVKETMETYSHVNDDMIKTATNIIEKIF